MSKTVPSVYTRLRNVFINKPTTIKPKPKTKTTVIAKSTATSASTKTSTPSVTVTTTDGSKSTTPAKKSRGMKKWNLEEIAQKFKKASESQRFRSRHNNYYFTIRRLASAREFSMVEDILEHQKKFDDITSEEFVIRIILLYGHAGMFDHALKLFDEMPNLKCERTVRSFNALLSACVHAQKFDKVEEILEDVSSNLGIQPDLVSYNTVTKAYCQMDALDKALAMLDELEKKGLKPNLITYNTLLQAFYKNNRHSEGDELWSVMESKNVAPDLRSYNSKIIGMINAEKVPDAVKLVDEIRRKGIKPDFHTYFALIKGFCNDGDSDEVKKWYSEMVKNGYFPDKITYGRIIPVLFDKGDTDMALELCKEAMDRFSSPGMFKPIIDGLVENSKVEIVKQVLELGNIKSYFGHDLGLSL